MLRSEYSYVVEKERPRSRELFAKLVGVLIPVLCTYYDPSQRHPFLRYSRLACRKILSRLAYRKYSPFSPLPPIPSSPAIFDSVHRYFLRQRIQYVSCARMQGNLNIYSLS